MDLTGANVHDIFERGWVGIWQAVSARGSFILHTWDMVSRFHWWDRLGELPCTNGV